MIAHDYPDEDSDTDHYESADCDCRPEAVVATEDDGFSGWIYVHRPLEAVHDAA